MGFAIFFCFMVGNKLAMDLLFGYVGQISLKRFHLGGYAEKMDCKDAKSYEIASKNARKQASLNMHDY